MFIDSGEHAGGAASIKFLGMFPSSKFKKKKKADPFFLCQPAGFIAWGFMRFGIEAAPPEQGRSPIAFGMSAGMLFQFLFCSFLVSVWRRSHQCWLMASFSLLPQRGAAACCGCAGVARGVEKCRSTVVLLHGFLVQRSKLW